MESRVAALGVMPTRPGWTPHSRSKASECPALGSCIGTRRPIEVVRLKAGVFLAWALDCTNAECRSAAPLGRDDRMSYELPLLGIPRTATSFGCRNRSASSPASCLMSAAVRHGFAEPFIERGFSYIGVDNDAKTTERLRARGLVVGNFDLSNHAGIPDYLIDQAAARRFSAILITDVLEHVAEPIELVPHWPRPSSDCRSPRCS